MCPERSDCGRCPRCTAAIDPGTTLYLVGGTQVTAFFFKPGTQVGYYSNAKEGQPHDLMLAVRYKFQHDEPVYAIK